MENDEKPKKKKDKNPQELPKGKKLVVKKDQIAFIPQDFSNEAQKDG